MKPLKRRNWSGRNQSLIPPASLTSLWFAAFFASRRKVRPDLGFTKAIFAVLSFIGMAGTCFGQGTVNWASLPPFVVTAQTNSQQYSPLFGGGSTGGGTIGNTAPASSGLVYYYELLYNTNFNGSQMPVPNTANALLGTWRDTGLTATNNNALSGGRLAPVNPNFAAVVPWDNGTTNNIMLVGWSANLGTSWPAVSNKLANWDEYSSYLLDNPFFGESATGYLTPQASGTAPGATVFSVGPTTNGLPIFSPNMQLYRLSPQQSGGAGSGTNYPDAALRAALELTNKVVFGSDGTIILTNTIFIHTNIVLDATGHRVTISGNHSNRVFYVGSDGDLTLSNLVIADGRSDQGAGVYNAGSVTAVNCTFIGNSVVGAAGSDNNWQGAGGAGGSGVGGAVWNVGLLRSSGCTFAGNSAVGGPGGQGGWGNDYPPMSPGAPGGAGGDGAGGALFNGGTARLVNCTLAANTSQGGAGGPGGYAYVLSPDYPPGPRGPNGAPGLSVAGIYDASGQCYVTNCTVALNSGTGIWTTGTNGSKLVNTLLAQNSPGGNGIGALTDFGHNLSSDATCAFTNAGSLNNAYPLLGPLTDNGGPTFTVALLPGCRAIDAGDTAVAPPTDQRGVARPLGMAADIGAYEFSGSTNPISPTVVRECTEAALRAAMSGGGHVTFACDGTIPLANTVAVITNTFLDAAGHQITVQGGVTLFQVNPNVAFSLANLKLTGGSATAGGGINNAGGVVNATNCLFTGNTASEGGAICNSGTLSVDLCVFIANSATGAGGLPGDWYSEAGGSGSDAAGGAICNFGTVAVSRCTFNNNSVVAGSGAGGYIGFHGDPGMNGGPGGGGGAGGNGKGGALYNAGTARVSNSTFAYNPGRGGNGSAGGDGGPNYGGPGSGGNGGNGGKGGNGVGAIFNSGDVQIINCTFASNSGSPGNGGAAGNGAEGNLGGSGGAGGNGGSGIGAIFGLSPSCQITNCTFAGNSGGNGSGGNGGIAGRTDYPYGNYGGTDGPPGSPGSAGTGGIAASGGKLVNTLLAANFPNCTGSITDGGHNLSSDGSCAFTAAGSMNNTDPKLGPLADNGGPTLTMALLSGSPAIDVGSAVGAPATDQRGVPRPQGAGVDIGAFEFRISLTFTGMTMLNTANHQPQFCGLSPNPTLTLQVSTNLLDWQDATNLTAGPNGAFQCVDPVPGDAAARFYRLKSGTP